MPHDPYAELIARLRKPVIVMDRHASYDALHFDIEAAEAAMAEAATALARLSAPVTEEEIEPLARRLAKIYTHGDPTKEREVWEFYKAEARAALTTHRAGRGM